jgi:hypothetical protein
LITLRYEFDLLRASHLPYDTIRYDIQKTHYAYPYFDSKYNSCRKKIFTTLGLKKIYIFPSKLFKIADNRDHNIGPSFLNEIGIFRVFCSLQIVGLGQHVEHKEAAAHNYGVEEGHIQQV